MSADTKHAQVVGCLRPKQLTAAVARALRLEPPPLALTITDKRGQVVRVLERFR